MKPRDIQLPNPPSAEELQAVIEACDRNPRVETAPRAPATARAHTGSDAAFMMALGITSALAGAALTIGPTVSWKLTQVSAGMKDLGVQGGVLLIGGLILISMALLRRGQIALSTPSIEQAEDRLLLEQLTKESIRTGQDLVRVESELVRLQSGVANSLQEFEDRVALSTRDVIAAMPSNENSGSEEAIYRLAASLDQVGMRIEQRLKTQYGALQDHLEDVGAAILSARNQVQGLQQAGENHVAALRGEVAAQVENALGATGYWSGNKRHFAGPSLGVLDSIEDVTIQSLPDVGSIGSALPAGAEEAREVEAPSTSMDSLSEMDTKTRLVQLSTLLADPKLRRALEGL